MARKPEHKAVIYESKQGKAMRELCQAHREECPNAMWSDCGGRHMTWLGCAPGAYDPVPTFDKQHPERCPYTGEGEAA